MAEVIDALRPLVALAQQAPAMVAMAGDSFDEMMQTALDSGIDVERGLLNGAGAALRFGATMNPEKVRALEALLNSGVLDPVGARYNRRARPGTGRYGLGAAIRDRPDGLVEGARPAGCPARARFPRHVCGAVRQPVARAAAGAVLTHPA